MLFAEALSERSDELYSSSNGGVSEALQFIVRIAKMISSYQAISLFLEHCIGRAANDQFGLDIFNFLLDERSGEYEIRVSQYVDKEKLKQVFAERMRHRYTDLKLAPKPLSLYPFRLWANFSEADRESCKRLFRSYTEGNIHRLMDVLAVFMPIGIWPEKTPIEFLDEMLEVDAVKAAIKVVDESELTQDELVVLNRVRDAFNGTYMKGPQFPEHFSGFNEQSDQYLKVFGINPGSLAGGQPLKSSQ
jgi:hypothetical protein